MNKKQSTILSLAIVAVLGVTQAYAQPTVNYSSGDLLLNMREVTASGTDLEVDLGNVISFADTYASSSVIVSSVTMAQDNFNEFNAYKATSPGKNTEGGDVMGLTGSAAVGSTLFLSRAVSGPGVIGSPSAPQNAPGAQTATAGVIAGVGSGAGSGQYGSAVLAPGDLVSADQGASLVTASSTGSYESLAETGLGNTSITFDGNQSTAPGAGGSLEFDAALGGHPGISADTSYADLWEVPANGFSGETYLGYFTFNSDGEVDYTGANNYVTPSAVPEPSTLALFAGLGLVAVAFRRQLRSLAV